MNLDEQEKHRTFFISYFILFHSYYETNMLSPEEFPMSNSESMSDFKRLH